MESLIRMMGLGGPVRLHASVGQDRKGIPQHVRSRDRQQACATADGAFVREVDQISGVDGVMIVALHVAADCHVPAEAVMECLTAQAVHLGDRVDVVGHVAVIHRVDHACPRVLS
jgi:hypothetical protein